METTPTPAISPRPQMLQTLCILSFIACGLSILFYIVMSFLLAVPPEKLDNMMVELQKQPQFENVDPAILAHSLGIAGLFGIIVNVVSLIGVILMWNLNKAGFFIYVVAEIATNFIFMNVEMDEKGSSIGSTIFSVLLDVAFIVMYAVNLKYMNGKKVAPEPMP